MKSWWQSKTIWVNVILFIIALLGFLVGEDWIKEYPLVVAAFGTIVGALNVILRFLTKKPIVNTS